MSTETDAALRAAAEEATPGPWTTDDSRNTAGLARVWQYRGLGIAECRYRGAENRKDAAFIALANPTAILDLLDRVEAAEAKVARVEALAETWIADQERHLKVTRRSAPNHRPCESGARAKAGEAIRAALGDPQ
jgi:hypothetical protein